MPAVDLDADLIPGTSAAGWRIGVRLPECQDLLRGDSEVEHRQGFNLLDAIDRNAGVLIVSNHFPLGSGNTAVVVGADVVRFGFNARGELFESRASVWPGWDRQCNRGGAVAVPDRLRQRGRAVLP